MGVKWHWSSLGGGQDWVKGWDWRYVWVEGWGKERDGMALMGGHG